MKDKATKPPFLTGFMIAVKIRLSIILRYHNYRYSALYHLYTRRYESYTSMPSLGGGISGAKFRQACFDCSKLLGREAADFRIISAPVIEIFLFHTRKSVFQPKSLCHTHLPSRSTINNFLTIRGKGSR